MGNSQNKTYEISKITPIQKNTKKQVKPQSLWCIMELDKKPNTS